MVLLVAAVTGPASPPSLDDATPLPAMEEETMLVLVPPIAANAAADDGEDDDDCVPTGGGDDVSMNVLSIFIIRY